MANKVLISQSNVVQAYTGQNFSGSDSARIIQFNPQVGVGFSGAVSIQGSYSPTPGNNDYTELLNVTFTGHTANLILEVQSNAPNIRAKITASTQGAIAVLADSVNRTIQGSQGATPATAFVESANRVAGSGTGFKINSIVVPQFTSDDVYYSNDLSKTITDLLDGTNGATGKQNKIGTGNITVTDVRDINNLAGTWAYGLRTDDFNKLADFAGTAGDLNRVASITAPVVDINSISGYAAHGITATEFGNLTGLTHNVESFITSMPPLSGLTASVNDLNTLAGISSGTNGYPGQISITELGNLNGSTSNIQTQLNAKRNIATTIGIDEITGNAITLVEHNYLQGVTGGVQGQIDALATTSVRTTGGTMTGALRIANGTEGTPGLAFASPYNTSGMYLIGGGNIGIAIGGAQFVRMTGTSFIIGTGVTTGGPHMQAATMGVSAPTYSFTNDDDTGMYRIGPNAVGIAGGGVNMINIDGDAHSITLGGAASANNSVAISGIFQGEKVLGTITVPTGSLSGVIGSAPIYVVPTGRTAIISRIFVQIENVAGFSSGATLRMNVGTQGTYNQILDNVSNPNIFNPVAYSFNTAGQVLPIGLGENAFPAVSGAAGAAYQVLTSNSTLRYNLVALANAVTFDLKLVVIGYEM